MESLVVKMRNVDTSYMEGFVADVAVPPPPDYFLGFRSPGTQVRCCIRSTIRMCAFSNYACFIDLESAASGRIGDSVHLCHGYTTRHD